MVLWFYNFSLLVVNRAVFWGLQFKVENCATKMGIDL